MSKRAEELAERILDTNFSARGTMSRKAVETIALIDAELRKERERCAERYCSACRPIGHISCPWMDRGKICASRAAILKEEP